MKLKEIRLQKGLTQQQVADMLGMKASSYSGLERGRYTINVKMLARLSEILEVPTDEILGLNDIREVLERNAKYYNDLLNKK